MTPQDTFLDAVKAGDLDAVSAMLQAEPAIGRSRDKSGASAVMVAIYYGHPDVGRRIGELIGEMDVFEVACLGDVCLMKNIVASHPEVINSFSGDGFTPLGFCAYFGHVECADFLLEAGAKPNVLSKNGLAVAPLHSALAGGHVTLARLLIENGADVNLAQGGEGFTPLHYCADIGDAEFALELVRHGADKGAKDHQGRTPAELAVHVGHDHVAEALA